MGCGQLCFVVVCRIFVDCFVFCVVFLVYVIFSRVHFCLFWLLLVSVLNALHTVVCFVECVRRTTRICFCSVKYGLILFGSSQVEVV